MLRFLQKFENSDIRARAYTPNDLKTKKSNNIKIRKFENQNSNKNLLL